jgi:Glycosyltransferase family 9 (heptosyltransferase)
MNTKIRSKTDFIDQDLSGNTAAFLEKHLQDFSSEMSAKADVPRFLVTMYKGIGDAVMVGLSAVDQIIKDEPGANGKIDVLCNSVQAEIFEHDPRINRIILPDTSFFPPSEMMMWLKGIKPDASTLELIHFLRDRHYAAVFAAMFAPGFYSRLRSPIVFPNLFELGKHFFAIRHQVDVPMSKIIRRMVSNYIGNETPMAEVSGEIPLYIGSEQVKNARAVVKNIKEWSNVSSENSRLLVVASDSTTVVTRPPVDLLAKSIAEALRRCRDLVVCILQGYTDANAAQNLFKALTHDFDGRVFLMPAEPRAKLLDVAAFIDQSDMFVSGDTGLMHLAATTKMLREGANTAFCPNNSVKIIALFGGTTPSIYGYSKRTIILGRGRKEQMAFIPGIAKESYNPRGKNLFDHIHPHQLTEAIIS